MIRADIPALLARTVRTFFATLKKELVYRTAFRDLAAARANANPEAAPAAWLGVISPGNSKAPQPAFSFKRSRPRRSQDSAAMSGDSDAVPPGQIRYGSPR